MNTNKNILMGLSLLLVACGGGGGGGGNVNTQGPAVPLDNTPRFVYLITNTIGAYVADPESETLIPRGRGDKFFDSGPTAATVSPDGRFLYVTEDAFARAIRVWRINPQTGTPSYDPTGDFDMGGFVSTSRLLMHPSGRFLFTKTNSHIRILSVATDTGHLTLLADVPIVSEGVLSVANMFMAPDASYLYTNSDLTSNNNVRQELMTYRIEPNGMVTPVDADPVMPGVQAQNFANVARPAHTGDRGNSVGMNSQSGDLYLTNLAGAVERYQRDPVTGLFSFIDTVPIDNSNLPLVFRSRVVAEPKGRFIYMRLDNNSLAGFSVDAATGALTEIDFDDTTGGIQHLDLGFLDNAIISFDPTGNYVVFAFDNNSVLKATMETYKIDPITGVLSQSAIGSERNLALKNIFGARDLVFTTRHLAPPPGPTYAYTRRGGAVGIHRVDPATGMMTEIDNFVTPGYNQFYIDAEQTFLYFAEGSAYTRVQIDPDTGLLSNREVRATSPVPDQVMGLRFDPMNRFALQRDSLGDGMDWMQVTPTGIAPPSAGVQYTSDPYTLTSFIGTATVRPNSRHLYATGLVAGSVGSTTWVMRAFEFSNTSIFDRIDASPASGHQDFALSDAPRDIVVEPLGRYLLSLEITSLIGNATNTDNLAVYELDWNSGVPTVRNAVSFPVTFRNYTTGSNPLHLVLDPRGRFVYVPTNDGIAAFRFTREPMGPVLTVIDASITTSSSTLLFQTLGANRQLAIDPTGQWLFAPGGGGIEGFRIDPVTGSLESVGIVSPDSTSSLRVTGNL